MSKKHFRGRRHIRAQWTVRVAREKRHVHKIERSLITMNNLVSFVFPKLIMDIFPPLLRALIDLRNSALVIGDVFREQKINE